MPPMNQPYQQWPQSSEDDLSQAALDGSTERTLAALSRESTINIADEGDPKSWNPPLMAAAQGGFSRVARTLQDRGANVSIATDNGGSALHLSAFSGQVAVTVDDLVKAGADLEARNFEGATPLALAAQQGHSEIMAALIEAGADVDARSADGCTPLYLAACHGRFNAVRELVRAKASPLLVKTKLSGETNVLLDAAAEGGSSKVVRELLQQFGIKGCAGASGCGYALAAAAEMGHVDIMAMLISAGVVDTGLALVFAAGWGGEVAVKFLLQQRQLQPFPTGLDRYVNFRDPFGGSVP